MLNVAVFLCLSAVLLITVLLRTHGHFSYCLDDPYIHLALAERIRHGLYGLNAGEPASPSSSILWPFLFVPFAGTAIMAWVPLVINLACGAWTAWLLGTFAEQSLAKWRERRGLVLSLGLLLVLGLNLFGLAFTGLEHSLEVLLCVLCALAVARGMRNGAVPWWGLAAAVLLPSIRYEGLLITFGVAIALAGLRQWGKAVGILAASAVMPAAFSVFLHRLGLPWFPLSVLVKSSYKFQDSSPLPIRAARMVVQAVEQSFTDAERLPQLVIAVLLVALACRLRRARSLSFALAGAAVVGAVQIVLGPVGWFYRYEIYALAFTLLTLVAGSLMPLPDAMQNREGASLPSRDKQGHSALGRAPIGVRAWLVVGAAAVLALIYAKPLVSVPRAAVGIYEQQYQIGRLMSRYDRGPVAVNDLGWVSFLRGSDQYVLDLYGLGSYEVFRVKPKDRTPAWLDAITREHGVGLVAIYPEWFPQGVPANWVKAAKLCAQNVDTSLGPVSRRVMLYRTPAAPTDTVVQALAALVPGLPTDTLLELNPTDDRAACGAGRKGALND